MFDLERGLALAYNGEVYNYRELRRRLERNWQFASDGDTEVVLAAYAHWGAACVEHFNGMFALAIWSESDQTLFLARDRLGEKPLYYMQDHRGFAFASEIPPLALMGANLDIEPHQLTRYITANTASTFEIDDTTLFRGVNRLQAAHTLTVRQTNGRSTILCEPATYWRIEQKRHGADIHTAAQEIAALLDESVKMRLRSDVPVGTCLSGGLDSSSIVSSIRKHEPEMELHTFTGAFPGNETADETKYALRVAEEFACTPHVVAITPEAFIANAPTFYAAAGMPVGGLSQFAQWQVFGLAAEHGVTVLLDGQGSDEIFGGYGGSITQSYLSSLLWKMRFREFARESRLVSDTYNHASVQRVKNLTSKWMHRSIVTRWLRPYLSREGSDLVRHGGPKLVDAFTMSGPNAFDHMVRQLTQETMLPSLLRYGDHLSMHFSREVRLPFCDHRIVEAAYSLDPSLLVGGCASKLVLREAMRTRLPSDIVVRPKQGFVPPEAQWFGGPLNLWMIDMLDGISPALQRYLNPVAIRDGIRRMSRGEPARLDPLWRLINLCAWDRYSRQYLLATQQQQ